MPPSASKALSGACLWYALGIVIAFIAWEAAALTLGQYRLLSFSLIAPKFFSLLTESQVLSFQGGGDRGFRPHLLHTIAYTIGASAMSAVAGVAFALAVVRSRLLRAVTEVPIELLRTIPPLAAIPFILIWTGPGSPAQLMMVGYCIFVMMFIATLNAVANANPVLPTFAATLGAGPNRIFLTVVLPALIPAIVGALRVSLGIAWGIQIVAELMGGKLDMGRVLSAMISFQALGRVLIKGKGIFFPALM